VLRLTLPPALKPLALRGTAFCTTAGNHVTCPMGDLPARQGYSVIVDVLALRPAATEVRADLTSGAPAAPALTATAPLRIRTGKPCGLTIRADRTGRGTSGGDRIIGGAHDDYLIGRAGDDCLTGRGGDDVLGGGDGDDDLAGGPGRDLVRGDAGDDYLDGGRGDDRFEAGPGNDRLDAVDGRHDLVRCGPGTDRATVDEVDSVTGCERVIRNR
jgi:Ca2+-binding RTX toxin-like protein